MAISHRLLWAALTVVVGALSTGCGDEVITSTTRVTSSSSYSAGYNSSSYSSGSSNPASSTGNPYSGTTGSNPYGMPTDASLAGSLGAATPAPSACANNPDLPGCTAAVPATGGATTPIGLSATITARQETGLLSKRLTGVTVKVSNNQQQAINRFLLVVYTRSGREVYVDYRSLQLGPGNSTTFQSVIPQGAVDRATGRAVEADDARAEIRDGLL